MIARCLVVLALIGLSCASAEEAGRRSEQSRSRPLEPVGFSLAQTDSTVRTVQVYRTGDETALPIVSLGTEQTITLAFDVMGNDPRPLSVFFYHASREWRRDLVPAEYMTSFDRDTMLDYESSRATHVPYVHYTYAFPNASIGFRLSGNYIVRVTEQGMEDDVLFEAPFYISEQTTALDFAIDNVRLTGDPFPALQPSVRFTPREQNPGSPFDYTVCFLRNGQLSSERCTDRPALDYQPALRYYLEPEASFTAQPADYFVDVANLRIGGRIEKTDLLTIPYELILEPDYFRFPGTAIAPLQHGQIVVDEAVRSVTDPGSAGEYVLVQFALVPDNESPVAGRVAVLGGFNRWEPTPESFLRWNDIARRYEGSVLVKQGRYEYRYTFSNPSVARASRGASPRFDNMITAFVYRNDFRVGTDRLLSAVSVVGR